MPTTHQTQRLTNRYLPRFTCKNICLTVLTLLLLTLPPLIFLGAIPWIRAYRYEQAYFSELTRLSTLDKQWSYIPDYRPNSPRKPPAYNKRVLPLIHDIPQLKSWSWEEQLDLYDDGSMLSKSPDKETWIYVGGTPKTSKSWVDKISLSRRPGGSCVDSGEICGAFNEGFNTLMERYHDFEEGGEYYDGPKERMSKAEWAFMDCDVSPLLCDEFALDPVMLVHIRSMKPCRVETQHGVSWVCGMRWTLVSLPLRQMPFVKTIRIGGVCGTGFSECA
ncbi:hypothetical protein DL98DRAFT_511247 [Cadophora sp. DSE1049]|nr:hypothetical protein DL98DRAFT_511247 [Cadophora sp. DSE1049]